MLLFLFLLQVFDRDIIILMSVYRVQVSELTASYYGHDEANTCSCGNTCVTCVFFLEGSAIIAFAGGVIKHLQ
ncbi:hypothetical protein E2C01_069254 [Portunus trituberculatus]|uniref:Uncharacterized protein n=1 Tax=Portunus trituberculatus TaxID=210409 RepID=A0A5B7HYV9_PORTR|nr:hypothetical protein [Portunus trituberculatus]